MTDPAAAKTLLERAADLKDATKRIDARNTADARAEGLGEALETFSTLRSELRPVLAQAQALNAHDVPLGLPTSGPQIAGALRALADRIDAKPAEVRERKVEVSRIEQYTTAVRNAVEETLRTRLHDARGAEAGTVRSLRSIGLDPAADTLASALATLDKFDARLPQTVEDLQAVDAAAESISTTVAALSEPRYKRLVEFFQRTSTRPQLTLEDVDPELLGELQSSGAAANFTIVPRER